MKALSTEKISEIVAVKQDMQMQLEKKTNEVQTFYEKEEEIKKEIEEIEEEL